MEKIKDKKTEPKENIQAVFAFLSQAPGGGVIAAQGPDGMIVPLVFTDSSPDLIKWARSLCEASGDPIKMVKFSNREDLEVFS